MGVCYVPLPLDEQGRAWLRREGVPFPDAAVTGRWPTPNELRAALESLAGYSVSYRKNTDGGWDAEVVDARRGYEGRSATVWTHGGSGDDEPHEFTFHKPSLELALMILEILSRVCGAFVLVDDASVTPVVIVPDVDVTALAARFRTTV